MTSPPSRVERALKTTGLIARLEEADGAVAEREVAAAVVEAPEVIRAGAGVVRHVDPGLAGGGAGVGKDHGIGRDRTRRGVRKVGLVQSCAEGITPTQVASATFRERSPTSNVCEVPSRIARTPIGAVAEEDAVVVGRRVADLELPRAGDILRRCQVGDDGSSQSPSVKVIGAVALVELGQRNGLMTVARGPALAGSTISRSKLIVVEEGPLFHLPEDHGRPIPSRCRPRSAFAPPPWTALTYPGGKSSWRL